MHTDWAPATPDPARAPLRRSAPVDDGAGSSLGPASTPATGQAVTATSATVTGPAPTEPPATQVASADLQPVVVAEDARRHAPALRRAAITRIKAALVCADAAAVVVGMVTATALHRWWLGDLPATAGSPNGVALVAAVSVPLWPVLFAQQGLYQSRRLSRRMEELRRIVNATLAGLLVLAGLSVVVGTQPDRAWLVLVFPCVTTFVYGERELARRILTARRAKGRMTRRVVVVGQNAEAEELATMLEDFPQHGYDVVGFVAEPSVPVVDLRTGRPLGPYLGTPQDVLDLCRATGASGVIVATTGTDLDSANRLIRELTREGLFVELTSAMRDISPSRISLRSLGPYPLLAVEPVAEMSWRRVAKRLFDVVMSSVLLLLVAPVLAAAAVAIRTTSGRGVLFRQARVGRGGREFTVYKLRTMVADAEEQLAGLQDRNEAAGPMFKMSDDPRVTPVGRFLRSTSLDELPQLWNVLRGDMSLVGPRPALPCEAAQWDDPLRERLRVKPGITGEWQISGRYRASIEDYARLDLHYVDNWSLVRDLVIMLKTVPAVLRGDGAA